MNTHLLHPEMLDAFPLPNSYKKTLEQRSKEVEQAVPEDAADPNITVLVRTRNNEARLQSTIDDIAAQKYNGEIQYVIVDTESTDRTRDIARAAGATIVAMEQASFSYPDSLNRGFERADHEYVLTLTNNTNPVSRLALRSLTRWRNESNFAGVYGAQIWDDETSFWEASLCYALNMKERRLAPAAPVPRGQGGALVAHRSIVSREAWQEAGGYDEMFGRGGEDADLATRLLRDGATIVRDPALSMHHSHGCMSLRRTLGHIAETAALRMGAARPFNHGYIKSTRPDMQ